MGATAIDGCLDEPRPSLSAASAARAKVISVLAPGGLPPAGPARAGEVLALPAVLLGRLPLPPRLGLHVAGVRGTVRVGASRMAPLEKDEADPDSEPDVVFDAEEWVALVVATEADRVWAADFRTFCERKRAEPAWRLELPEALAGGQPDPAERWDLGRVLRRLAADVLSVEL